MAISNHWIQSVDSQGVTFEYKDYKTGGEKKLMTLETGEFIRRFARHILPPKFRRMRHYGFLSNAAKGKALPKIRTSLRVKAVEKMDRAARREAARERMFGQNASRCPCCKVGTMIRIGVLPPLGHQAKSMTRAPPVEGQMFKDAIWLD